MKNDWTPKQSGYYIQHKIRNKWVYDKRRFTSIEKARAYGQDTYPYNFVVIDFDYAYHKKQMRFLK